VNKTLSVLIRCFLLEEHSCSDRPNQIYDFFYKNNMNHFSKEVDSKLQIRQLLFVLTLTSVICEKNLQHLIILSAW